MFKSLFRKKTKPIKKYLVLTKVAKSLAVSSFIPFCEKFPELKNVYELELINDYERLVKSAGISIALMRLSSYYNMEKSTEYTKSIMSELNNEETKLIADFGQYLEEIADGELINEVEDFYFHVGEWIFAHLAENSNNDNEIEILAEHKDLKSDLGKYMTITFQDFWVQ